jgi:ATP-dependent exoDNAse (exonuclease V) beta subunit
MGTEDPDANDKEKRQKDAVTLMTLHSAKGLEYPHVYLVGLEEGILPHQRSLLDGGQSLAEERRLCYVGVTRARDTLTITLSKHRMKWGKLHATLPSRFLFEMRGETQRAARVVEEITERIEQKQKPKEPQPKPGKKGARKRGAKTKAEVEARIEAEVKARVEAEIQARIEAEIQAKAQAQPKAKAAKGRTTKAKPDVRADA